MGERLPRKRGVVWCFVAGAVIAACDEETAPPGPVSPDYEVETRIIRDIDFARNQYFYFDNPLLVDITQFHPDDRHPSLPIEIWVEITPDEKLDPALYGSPGKALVDTAGDGSALRAAADRIRHGLPLWPYRHLAGDFRRLEYNVHYRFLRDFDTDAVQGLAFRLPVAEHLAVAASYVTAAGDTVGGPYSMRGIPHGGGAERDTMILKMIKPKYPRPDDDFGFTWYNTKRNVYDLGLNFIAPAPDSVQRWTGGEFSFADSLYSERYAKSRRLYIHYLTNPPIEAYQYDIVVRVKRYL